MPQITVKIDNQYEDGDVVVTAVTATVPPAPFQDDHDAYQGWADEYVRPLTGTGRQQGDAWYDVEVVASDDPQLVGRVFTWGY